MNPDNWLDKQDLRNPRNIVDDLPTILITIQSYTEIQNDMGEIEKTWIDKYTDVECIMDVTDTRDRENLASPYNISTHRFYVAYDIDIQTKDRIIYNDRIFNVITVKDDSNQDILIVETQELIQ